MRHSLTYIQVIAVALLLSACGKAEFGTNGVSIDGKSSSQSVELPSLENQVGDATGQIHDVGDLANDPSLADLYACGNKKEKKVLICHVPPGNSAAAHTICIGAPALDAHMALHEATDGAHDTLGECPAATDEAPAQSGECNKKK
jgi:hypothetical protein